MKTNKFQLVIVVLCGLIVSYLSGCKEKTSKQKPAKPVTAEQRGPTGPDAGSSYGREDLNGDPNRQTQNPDPSAPQNQQQIQAQPQIVAFISQGFNNGNASVSGNTIYLRQAQEATVQFAVIDANSFNQNVNGGFNNAVQQGLQQYNWQIDSNNSGTAGQLFISRNQGQFAEVVLQGLQPGTSAITITANSLNNQQAAATTQPLTAPYSIQIVDQNVRNLGSRSNAINAFQNGNGLFDDGNNFFDDNGGGIGGILGNIGSSILDFLLNLFR